MGKLFTYLPLILVLIVAAWLLTNYNPDRGAQAPSMEDVKDAIGTAAGGEYNVVNGMKGGK